MSFWMLSGNVACGLYADLANDDAKYILKHFTFIGFIVHLFQDNSNTVFLELLAHLKK